jgi:hypothetical protein
VVAPKQSKTFGSLWAQTNKFLSPGKNRISVKTSARNLAISLPSTTFHWCAPRVHFRFLGDVDRKKRPLWKCLSGISNPVRETAWRVLTLKPNPRMVKEHRLHEPEIHRCMMI